MKKTLFLMGVLALVLTLSMAALSGCSFGAQSAMKDGYYTAEMSAFSAAGRSMSPSASKGGSIASVEYNAVDPSGYIKAWDMAYMRSMGGSTGMYPNRYTREYAKQLMEKQSADGIDTISGATVSGGYFRLLADAVIQMAMRGGTMRWRS